MLMGFVHVGHNVTVGNRCVLANNSGLAGHVVIEDKVIISVGTGIHQFCRVGTLSLTGPYMKITRDIPPYSLVEKSAVMGLNIVGLKRNGVDLAVRKSLKAATKCLFFSDKLRAEAVAEVEETYGAVPQVRYLLDFLASSKRGILAGFRK
jgi:UDP-N-acetylglucosamine acyltransferase